VVISVQDKKLVGAGVTLLVACLATAAFPTGTGQAATTLPPRDTTEAISVGADHHTIGGISASPAISADGHYVLYTSNQFADAKVVLHDRVAKTDAVLFTADEQQYARSLDLSADDRYAYFYTDDVSDGGTFGNHPHIHRYNVTTGHASLVPLPDFVKAADNWQILSMRSSTNGRYIVASYAVYPDDQVAEYGFSTYVTDLSTRQTTDLGIGIAPTTPGPHQTTATDISGDGRFVAYDSSESYSPNDGNAHTDSYVLNWRTGAKTLVSRRPDGAATNDNAYGGVLSSNGRYVTFDSNATDGLPGLAELHLPRVYQYDTQTGTTILITADTSNGGNYGALCGASDTGRYVAFTSGSEYFGFPSNPDAKPHQLQVYRYDRNKDALDLVSHARRQAWGSRLSADENCSIAGSGHQVAFASHSRDMVIDPNLVDGFNTLDVFVWAS
jgi:hypothetical protein